MTHFYRTETEVGTELKWVQSSNGRKIARIDRISTIFGPNRSPRRDLKFQKFSNECRRHRGIVVVVVVIVAVVVVGRFWVASITEPSLFRGRHISRLPCMLLTQSEQT